MKLGQAPAITDKDWFGWVAFVRKHHSNAVALIIQMTAAFALRCAPVAPKDARTRPKGTYVIDDGENRKETKFSGWGEPGRLESHTPEYWEFYAAFWIALWRCIVAFGVTLALPPASFYGPAAFRARPPCVYHRNSVGLEDDQAPSRFEMQSVQRRSELQWNSTRQAGRHLGQAGATCMSSESPAHRRPFTQKTPYAPSSPRMPHLAVPLGSSCVLFFGDSAHTMHSFRGVSDNGVYFLWRGRVLLSCCFMFLHDIGEVSDFSIKQTLKK